MGLKDSLEVSKNAINNSKINTSHNKKINNIHNSNNIINDYNHNYYDNNSNINSGVIQNRNNQNTNMNNFNNIVTNKNNKEGFDILGNNEEEISLDMFTKVNTVSNMSKQNYDINISKEKTDVSNENLSNITDNNYEIPKIVIRPKGSK
jgi:GATA zinc finger domain-containing protein 4